MLIFAIIMFGLSGVRTLSDIVKTIINQESIGSIIGAFLLAITYWWCYVWFLTQFVTLK